MLQLLFALGLLVFGMLLLIFGADWFLDGVNDLARSLGMSALVLGVLLAGLEPEEMLTAAIASARGAPSLALGDVVGSNITIVTAALGLSALVFPMIINRDVRKQALIATLVSVLPIVLLFSGSITRLEGILLLAVFIAYTVFLFRTDRKAFQRIAEDDDDDENEENNQDEHFRSRVHWKPVVLTFGGLAAMAIGGPAIVEGALRLTQALGLSQGKVGATVVAFGTGAEMIALGVSAAHKEQSDVLVGGILGSFAYNLLVTLGLAAAIHPIPVEGSITSIALPVMIAAHLILLALVWYGKVPRIIGSLLVGFYIAYLIVVVLA